jgi:trigger factor
MKTNLKKIDACKREITIEIPKDVVEKKFDEVYKEIQKVVQIKGFRPGMAPMHLVQAQHSKLAKEEVIKDLIPNSYKEALDKEKLLPVDLPEVSEVNFKDGGFSFKATFEVVPEVKIKKYKGLEVKRKKTEATDDDLNKSLGFLRESKGLDKDAPLDDSFAKGLGYVDMNELKQTIKKQLELAKEQDARIDMENQIVTQLLENSELEIPQSSVDKQLNYLLEEAKHRMAVGGMKKEEIEAKEKDLKEQLKQTAVNDVKAYFILDKIAELENIKAQKSEQKAAKVIEFLLKEAKWQ